VRLFPSLHFTFAVPYVVLFHEQSKYSLAKDKNELLFSRFKCNYDQLPAIYRKGSILCWETDLITPNTAAADATAAAADKSAVTAAIDTKTNTIPSATTPPSATPTTTQDVKSPTPTAATTTTSGTNAATPVPTPMPTPASTAALTSKPDQKKTSKAAGNKKKRKGAKAVIPGTGDGDDVDAAEDDSKRDNLSSAPRVRRYVRATTRIHCISYHQYIVLYS
jgi:hypothetical protein